MLEDEKPDGRELADSAPGMQASLTALLIKSDGTHGAIRTGGEGVAISADVTTEGDLSRSLKAAPRHGEAGVLDVCRVLISKMNRDGASWSNPEPEPEGRDSNVDCRAIDANGRQFDMQVTRLNPPGLWKNVRSDREMLSEATLDEAIAVVREAIDAKRYIDGKSKIHLVLDATQTPDLAFQQVADAFRSKHGTWAKSLGFVAIWLVGTVEALVHRLDGVQQAGCR